jgi:sporulation-control protein spo0M
LYNLYKSAEKFRILLTQVVCWVLFLQQEAEEILPEIDRRSTSLRGVASELVGLVERQWAKLLCPPSQYSEKNGRRKTQSGNINIHFNKPVFFLYIL